MTTTDPLPDTQPPRFRLLREFGAFLWEGKRFWLLPIVAALVLVGALVVFSEASPLSPFIYPFF